MLVKVESLLATIPVLPLDLPAGAEYAAMRAELEAASQPVGMSDLLIAAHAKALGSTLVTDATSVFNGIRGSQE